MNIIAEYVWIDGDNGLRSKTKTIFMDNIPNNITNNVFPIWNYDGSSTNQATTNDSEVLLHPKFSIKDPFRKIDNSYIVLCDCYSKNGEPIESNKRNKADTIFNLVGYEEPWFGLEQEYYIMDINGENIYRYSDVNHLERGINYCSAKLDLGRNIVDEHYEICLKSGLKISGVNSEVEFGQYEFQIGPCEGIELGDHLWMARYLLERVADKHNAIINYKPKLYDDWNKSGCHINYSTKQTRSIGGMNEIYRIIGKLENSHEELLEVYGDNSERLTGTHETSSMDKFTFGVGDRTASVRIPTETFRNKRGYIEDRRPASDIDPYDATSRLAALTLI